MAEDSTYSHMETDNSHYFSR